ACVAERLRARRAVVLEPAHWLVVDLERARQRQPALAREERAQPERVDVLQVDARRRRRVLRRVDQQVADTLVPALAERRAAHANDRHAVANPVAGHLTSSEFTGSWRALGPQCALPSLTRRAFQK